MNIRASFATTATALMLIVLGRLPDANADDPPEADAKAATATPCTLANKGGNVVVSASPRPQARILLDLTSSAGRSISVAFEASADAQLAHEVRLLGTGDSWTASAVGERITMPTADGRGSVFLAYVPCNCDSENKEIKLTLKMLVFGVGKATWVTVDHAPLVTVTVTSRADASLAGVTAADAASSANALVRSTRGLDSAIPDALRETLSLLAEIAIDRAKAEGARMLKSRIQKYLCEELTLHRVFGTSADASQRLFPATCGQLENLRFSDLGASATGFIDALREDTVDVVLPALVACLPSKLPASEGLSSPTAVAVYRIAATAVRRGFNPESVRLAAVSLLDIADIPAPLKRALRVAIQCTKQECSIGDLQALTAELLAAANVPPSRQPAIGVVDPFWVDAALRLVTILQSRADADGAKLGGELVDLLLDVVKRECNKDRKCEVITTAVRDVTVGVVEGDYLRALGGLQAAFAATGLNSKLKGKPLELAASIASYVSTYRATKNEDAGVARDLRKQALEGLIDAATDRTNRERDIIVSLGASVGFTGGWRVLDNAPSGATVSVRDTQALRDVRLPIGVTVQRLPPADRFTGVSWYGMLAFADLAQFVSAPVSATVTDMMTQTTTTVEPEITWSDFVAFEVQVGARFGNARIPLTVGLDFYYRPRMRLEIAGESQTSSVFHAGLFAGFNVPFFDLN